MSEFAQLAPSSYAEFFASAADAIVLADDAQRVLLFNAAAEKMFGREAQEARGLPVQRIIVEGLRADSISRPETRKVGGHSDAGGTFCRLTGVRGDGTQFPLEAAISGVEWDGRSIFMGILRDGGAHSLALGMLRRSEQAFEEAFANSPIGVMCVAPDGRVERVNEAQLRLLERSRDAVVGKSVRYLHTNEDRVGELLERVAVGETVHDFHLHTLSVHGLKHLLVDATGVWEDGALLRNRWFVRDITSRVKLEREILSIADSERQRIGQDLHDDICQQLVAIEFMVEAMAARLDAKSPVADQAHSISFHLRSVIDHTREIARGMAPNLPDHPESLMTALQDLADRTTKVFQRECRFECPQPVLSTDAATTMHLYRIAQEAVANAIKHGQARCITIRLFRNGGDIVLGVKDDGNGASPNPEKRRGMGLRVMQYRAGVIGGSLMFQRVPHEGTSVVCTVKAASAEPKAGP